MNKKKKNEVISLVINTIVYYERKTILFIIREWT